jgi:hypothetical protein
VTLSDLRREAGKRGRETQLHQQPSGQLPANGGHLHANGGQLRANGDTPAPAPALKEKSKTKAVAPQNGASLFPLQVVPSLSPKRKAKADFNAAALELPAWLPRDAWAEFCAYRTEKRKPLTKLAATKNLNRLSELWAEGQDPRAVIDRTIAAEWVSFWPVNSSKNCASEKESYLQRNLRENLENLAISDRMLRGQS